MSLVVAGALVAGMASRSEAQVSIAVGNGYGYPGYGIGAYPTIGYPASGGYRPGYGVGYTNFYAPGYLARPGGFVYSSGYRGVGPAYGGYGYGGRPYARGYGFRPFGGGFRRGFR